MKTILLKILINTGSFILAGIFISSCASSSKTSTEIVLPNPEKKVENNSNLVINVPTGWRKIQDNKEKLFELWLVNSENNASISFIPIHIDSNLNGMSLTEKLNFVGEIILKEKKAGNEGFELVSKSVITDSQGLGLIYKIGNQRQRSIIFGNENRLYECLAYYSQNESFSEAETNKLFEIQEDIVKNSTIK